MLPDAETLWVVIPGPFLGSCIGKPPIALQQPLRCTSFEVREAVRRRFNYIRDPHFEFVNYTPPR